VTDEPHPRSFLAQVDPAGRRTLAQLGTSRDYRPRTALFHQGEPSRHVLVLVDGWVKVTLTSRTGEEALLAIRGPGDIVGDQSAVDGKPRSATVTALTQLTARVIDGERFLDCLSHHPAVALGLLRHLSANLRESDYKRLEYVSASSSSRLAALLLSLVAEHGEPSPEGVVINLPLTQRELATAAATSREVVARTLRTLRARDIVRTRRQAIVVMRPEVLRSLCQPPM
jgi:CRP/FNR family cyclic AMP-dependent transcriptional regulator